MSVFCARICVLDPERANQNGRCASAIVSDDLIGVRGPHHRAKQMCFRLQGNNYPSKVAFAHAARLEDRGLQIIDVMPYDAVRALMPAVNGMSRRNEDR